jgi:AcrR family transcriptional regulator
MTPPTDSPIPGLRERKKNKTRKIIQREALRLFRMQGYEVTTISQIAAAAEISESTFFRYFPAKEDIVRWDEFDPLIIEAFEAQPAGTTTIAALRDAFRGVLNRLSAEERLELRERILLALSIPHTLGAEQLNEPMQSLVEVVARRAGREPNDFGVRILVGAVLGAGMATMLAAAENPEADIVILLDEALAHLETGFSI